jgi:hypothetical protein
VAAAGEARYHRLMNELLMVMGSVVVGGLLFAASIALLSGGEW